MHNILIGCEELLREFEEEYDKAIKAQVQRAEEKIARAQAIRIAQNAAFKARVAAGLPSGDGDSVIAGSWVFSIGSCCVGGGSIAMPAVLSETAFRYWWHARLHRCPYWFRQMSPRLRFAITNINFWLCG